NRERAAQGAPPLRWSEPCARAAQVHARWMAASGTLSHVGRDGSRLAGRVKEAGASGATVAVENLASGQRTAQEVFFSWRDSEDHWTNLVDPELTHAGASYCQAEDPAGTHYWTLVLVRIP